MVSKFKERVRDKSNEPTFREGLNFKSFKTLDIDNTLLRVMFQFARVNSQNINVW